MYEDYCLLLECFYLFFFIFNFIDDIVKYFNCKFLNINMYDKILLKYFFFMFSYCVGMKFILFMILILWKVI